MTEKNINIYLRINEEGSNKADVNLDITANKKLAQRIFKNAVKEIELYQEPQVEVNLSGFPAERSEEPLETRAIIRPKKEERFIHCSSEDEKILEEYSTDHHKNFYGKPLVIEEPDAKGTENESEFWKDKYTKKQIHEILGIDDNELSAMRALKEFPEKDGTHKTKIYWLKSTVDEFLAKKKKKDAFPTAKDASEALQKIGKSIRRDDFDEWKGKVNTAQVMDKIGVSKATFYNMINDHKFPEKDGKIKQANYWKQETLDKWIAENPKEEITEPVEKVKLEEGAKGGFADKIRGMLG